MQLGKWQRVFTEPSPRARRTTSERTAARPAPDAAEHAPAGQHPAASRSTRAPSTRWSACCSRWASPRASSSIPRSSAAVPTAAGRVHFYEGSIYNGGAIIDANTPTEAALTEAATVMNSYDVVLFPCQGGAGDYNAANGFPNTLANLITYTTDGGRVFATHYHYDLLDGERQLRGDGELGQRLARRATTTATRVQRATSTRPSRRGRRSPSGSTSPPCTAAPRARSRSASSATTSRPSTRRPSAGCTPQAPAGTTAARYIPIHYTFDTPFGASPGRAAASSTATSTSRASRTAPTHGRDLPGRVRGRRRPMTPQEKLLEFMLFDLTSCVSPPTCTPLTCASFPAARAACRATAAAATTANCGTCTAPADVRRRRRRPASAATPTRGACAPETCAQQNITAARPATAAATTLQCGTCTPPQTCGGGGMPGQCGYPDGGACTPETCAEQNINCGPAGDGCGNALQCGTCTPPQTCGGGGVPASAASPTRGACTPDDLRRRRTSPAARPATAAATS